LEKLIVRGPARIRGEIRINGAKNSALPIVPAAILADSVVTLENIPRIEDIKIQMEIIESLGARAYWLGANTVRIDPTGVKPVMPPYELVKKLRASYYLMGILLARFGRGKVPVPGGCDLGPRPIDQHIKGLSSLGADIKQNHGIVEMKAKLAGGKVYLDVVSVGATINIMLAAVLTPGRTTIENCAKEPEIVDLASFLNAMGGNVRGAGTDVIKIDGVKSLQGTTYSIIPDRIETGTYMLAAAATGGDILLHNVIPKHMDPVIAKLKETGAIVEVGEDTIAVRSNGEPLKSVDVKTFPYPGYPTDLQSMMTVLLTQSMGTGIITENIFEARFRFVGELKRMGADIKVEGRSAVIRGMQPLTACQIKATDLRAGAACVVAGLVADGVTEVSGVEHLDRGYDRFEESMRSLGVDVERIPGTRKIYAVPGKGV
jgi:UDP-N-acetylglucosamine 1-carboxyvinyltransferase